MIKEQQIEDQFVLHPKQLDSNVYKHIYNTILEKNKNSCNSQCGYILDISEDDIQIINNQVSRINENIVVTVKYRAKTCLPMVGDTINANINVIMECGIFFEIYDVVNILVMKHELELKGYTLTNDSLIHEQYKTVYSKGDRMKIRITKSKFDNGKFIYIGELSN